MRNVDFRSTIPWALVLILSTGSLSCSDQGDVAPSGRITTDAELYRLITVEQPFSAYALFPNVDSIASGTLNGSTAHQPFVRVSMNSTAFNALVDGRLPPGSIFPGGSIIFKQIRDNTGSILYAITYKDPLSPYSGNGWLWAEIRPDGTPFISLRLGGRDCTGCHAREEGPQHDFVRTFERQR